MPTATILPLGRHQGVTEQVWMFRSPHLFKTTLVPRGSSEADCWNGENTEANTIPSVMSSDQVEVIVIGVDDLAGVPLSLPTYVGILVNAATSAARQLGQTVSWQAHQLESTWH